IPNGEESIALAACGSPLPVAQLDYHCDTHGDVVAVVASGVLAPTRTAAQTAPGNTTDLARELLRQMREIERAERIVTAAARRVYAPLVADAVQRVHGDTELDDALTLAAPHLEHLTAADNGGHGYDPEEFDELDAQDHQLIRQITDTNSSLDDDDGGGDEQGTTTAAAKKRKNWVDRAGGLPSYIKRIAKHLRAKGMTKSRAIATAVNVVKKMCRGGDKLNFPGVQRNVRPSSVAQACAAVTRWNAMKAKAKADREEGGGAAWDATAVVEHHGPARVPHRGRRTGPPTTRIRCGTCGSPEPPSPPRFRMSGKPTPLTRTTAGASTRRGPCPTTSRRDDDRTR